MAKVGQALGMQVIAARRPYDALSFPDDLSENGIDRISLPELLRRSHVVSLHCPLNPDTENMIDSASLATMRDDALLINTARGGLVDSAALIAALESGRIAGAAIDVLRQEPPVGPEPLVDARLPNLLVTPHIAWAAKESRQRAIDEIAANIQAFMSGEHRNRVA